MEFRPLQSRDFARLHTFFSAQAFRLSDYSVGFQIMWQPYAKTQIAEVEECLLLASYYEETWRFSYPIHPAGDEGKELGAVEALEQWCVAHGVPLVFEVVPEERLMGLIQRYGRDLNLTNPRPWRDYLYRLEDFVEFAGRRFAGQRNHLSKFRRLYPEATFRLMTPEDLPRVREFLRAFSGRQLAKQSFVAHEELHGVELLLEAFPNHGLLGGVLEDAGKVIAMTLGEVVGDTLVIHVEKALVGYEGVYPALAHAFAKAMGRPGVTYINREDDAGDCGLRKSKLQYNPVRLLNKYIVSPQREIDRLSALPRLRTNRLELCAVKDSDVAQYGRLARDLERSRLWGWDWSQTWKACGEGEPEDAWFLDVARRDFAEKREAPLGIYLDGKLIGECVWHNFSYDSAVEVGARLLPEYEHQGYATEAIRAIADYALCAWGLDRVVAKCFRENEASAKMLRSAGFIPDHDDAQFLYFLRTAKN